MREVKRWLEEGKPEKLQKLRLPPDLLTYWRHLKWITIKDGLLCKKWILHHRDTNEIEVQRFLVLVPESLQETVLDQHHASLLTMHPGVEETYNQILRRYYWPKLKDEVDLYVKSCVTCGSFKQPRAYLKAPLKHVITYTFGDAISIDHIIPTQEGATKRGNRYILTLSDLFSGYVVALPCKTKTSAETKRLILHGWCLKYGYPQEIIHDNDPGFSSEFFNDILAYFKITNTHGTPYKCSSTSKAERSNKRINQALRITLTDKQIPDWDLYLNYVTFALNSLKSRHTGVSANFMLYGKHLNTPLDLQLDGAPLQLDKKTKKNTTAYGIYRTIRDICIKARRHAELDFQYSDNSYNKRLQGPYFDKGDWVYTLIECPAHKFSKRWQGPYLIIKKLDDHLYVIDLGAKEKLVNIGKLKRYIKSCYSPAHLNAEAPEFRPNTSSTAQETEKRVTDRHDREGMEVEFISPQVRPGSGHRDNTVSQPETLSTDDWVMLDLPVPPHANPPVPLRQKHLILTPLFPQRLTQRIRYPLPPAGTPREADSPLTS